MDNSSFSSCSPSPDIRLDKRCLVKDIWKANQYGYIKVAKHGKSLDRKKNGQTKITAKCEKEARNRRTTKEGKLVLCIKYNGSEFLLFGPR